MAIEKVTTYDMEIVGESPLLSVQVRTKEVYVEDDVQISTTFSRHVIFPYDDWSSESQTVQNFVDALFTDEVKAGHAAFQEANPGPPPGWEE